MQAIVFVIDEVWNYNRVYWAIMLCVQQYDNRKHTIYIAPKMLKYSLFVGDNLIFFFMFIVLEMLVSDKMLSTP